MNTDLVANRTLAVLACTHKIAPLAVREKLAIEPERLDRFLENLRALPSVAECLVLSTCNRIEIYVATDDADVAALRRSILALLAAHQSLAAGVLAAHCCWLSGLPALEHLFHVAAGVDSQMIGETEILGQVKDAYEAAFARRDTGAFLNRAFQKSFQAAAWVHSQTPVTHGQVSIGNIAVELASRIFGNLSRSRILVLGTGEVGRKTARAFLSRGALALTVASRGVDNARNLAADVGGRFVEMADALRSLDQHDIIIGSASVTSALVSADVVRTAAAARSGDPLFLIDLGLPRNFPPDSGTIRGVYLYNLDDLSAIANENLRARFAAVDAAKIALAAKAARLWERLRSQ
ncbi:MAG: glutamyl-tRNA reductase [Puniceicoccales bacterium]|nr:glutamyl-tRNA reductase [Puniceicoccales bacterium]